MRSKLRVAAAAAGVAGMGLAASTQAMSLPEHVYGDPVHRLPGMVVLQETPAARGGVGDLSTAKLESVSGWMDNPSTRTGQFTNRLAGSVPVHPLNHGAQRHNPEAVARALSGDGSVDAAKLNAARVHKLQDIATNKAPVDGYDITRTRRAQARTLLRRIDAEGRVPADLPAWVDESGPGVTRPGSGSAGEAAEKAAHVLVRRGKQVLRIAVPVATAVEIAALGYTVYRTEEEFTAGRIDRIERAGRHAEAAAGTAGGAAGAAVGGALGVVGGPPGVILGVIIGGAVGDWTSRTAASATWHNVKAGKEEDVRNLTAFFSSAETGGLTEAQYRAMGFSDEECKALAAAASR